MAVLKKKMKNILGLISIGVLFAATALGILTKESNPKIDSGQSLSRDYRSENLNVNNFAAEIEKPQLICSHLLENQENDLMAQEYAKTGTAECLLVGSGGFF